jgi:hypothetical protein
VITRLQFAIQLRRRLPLLLMDDCGDAAGEVAVYTLSDPRDVRDVRYVGQTRSPRSRYRQHVNKASPWLPDHMPWWFKSPKDRPLHEWIRDLHRDGARLPVMIVTGWHADVHAARDAERALIFQCMEEGLRIFNVEAQIAQRRKMRMAGTASARVRVEPVQPAGILFNARSSPRSISLACFSPSDSTVSSGMSCPSGMLSPVSSSSGRGPAR